jgi:hypothetical protein
VDNLIDDPQGALTGPLARGDTATQARNLAALGDSALADLYRTFIGFHQGQSPVPNVATLDSEQPKPAQPDPVARLPESATTKRSLS